MKICLFPGAEHASMQFYGEKNLHPHDIDEMIVLLRIVKAYLIRNHRKKIAAAATGKTELSVVGTGNK